MKKKSCAYQLLPRRHFSFTLECSLVLTFKQKIKNVTNAEQCNFRFAGDWQVDYVTGGPFQVPVSDSLDVKVYSMKDGTICNLPHLIGILIIIVKLQHIYSKKEFAFFTLSFIFIGTFLQYQKINDIQLQNDLTFLWVRGRHT